MDDIGRINELMRKAKNLFRIRLASEAEKAFNEWDREVGAYLQLAYPRSGESTKWIAIPEPDFTDWDRVMGYDFGRDAFHENVQQRMSFLANLAGNSDEERPPPAPSKSRETKRKKEAVFVVHGHDESVREKVARFIEKLDLNPIILHEQPNQGRTIIEKFEKHSNVGFAVVLLTADDIGAEKNASDSQRPRARQNVILELGYFVGKLGRGRVCPLYEEGVELPSDLHGVVYVPLDAGEGWRPKLAKELQAAGLPVDPNGLL